MGAELPALTGFMLVLSKFVTSISFAIGAPIVTFIIIYAFRTVTPRIPEEYIDNFTLKSHYSEI